ncbi:MAG TPA: methylmalonyl Co-A mutase-associated GTPase MeaB [Acidovorax sp.]|nr:methylmalonyl Co-A mutase-associated GTPase MeaB [Acidovorax sp.]
MRPFYVYILRCADGSYYVGHTDDMELRMQQHQNGDVGYTALRKPIELLWQGEFETREGALAFELQVKGWSRAKKEALMAGDWERVQELAQSHGNSTSAPWLRQAQPERVGGDEASTPPTVQPEPVEGRTQPVQAWLTGIIGHPGPVQRRAMSKAITLLESSRADHRAQADELLTQLLPHTGKSFRLGISGVPGVGKSTFIEALGLYLIAQGHRVAVLTIDPSSTVSGGSILGDKTRMEHLSVHEKAYIRPSPSSGTLGGVAEKTREAMLVCEAAGYDVVIVETVGVGQSEIAVAGMTDMFVLMQLPNAGDDLQAIKKGVMEIADLVVINKADIDKNAATRAEAQITSSLRLLSQHGNPENAHHNETQWHPKVVQISALLGQGVDAFWAAVTQFRQLQTANGRIGTRREKQALSWMWERIDAGLKLAFRQHPQVRELLPQMQADVAAGRIAASTAARNLLLAQSGQAPEAIK